MATNICHSFGVEDACFFRCTFYLRHENLTETILRGTRCIVKEIHDGNIVVKISDRRYEAQWFLAVEKVWLEPYPGTLSIGFQRLLDMKYDMYSVGMMVTDVKFPSPDLAAHQRFTENRNELFNNGLGLSLYDNIDARNILESFEKEYNYRSDMLRKVGLVVVEHIWPWKIYGDKESGREFQITIARSLLHLDIPVIMLMRIQDVHFLECEFGNHKRFVFLKGKWNVKEHYRALRMRWESMNVHYSGGEPAAVVIHPSHSKSDIGKRLPLHVPHEILLRMFDQKKTLMLACGTLEGPLACVKYLQAQSLKHNLRR
jgi:hypothetical protein